MKTLKFLFFVFLLCCFIGITQTNAQAPEIARMEGTILKAIIYEVDGVPYYGITEQDFHAVGSPFVPVEFLNWTSCGPLLEVAKILDDGMLDWLDYIPLPRTVVNAYDPGIVYYEKITISPDGMVRVNVHLPSFYKFDLLY